MDVELLGHAARMALEGAGGSLQTLSLALVDDDRMRVLNHRYRAVDGPTDVIAFEAEDQPDGPAGEVIISVATAVRQAREAGHALGRELCLLTVHGVLHVLGHDDASAEGAARMSALQEQIVADLEERL